MAVNKWSETGNFLKNHPNQFEVSTKVLKKHAVGLPIGLKTFYVNGDPIECTLECDYAHINVSGNYHRLYIIGIRNQVNFTGNLHSVYFEGFHNQVNFCTNGNEWKIYVFGNGPLSYEIGVSNGQILSDGGVVPKKLEFSSSLEDKRRHRLQWLPLSDKASNNEECEKKEEDMEE